MPPLPVKAAMPHEARTVPSSDLNPHGNPSCQEREARRPQVPAGRMTHGLSAICPALCGPSVRDPEVKDAGERQTWRSACKFCASGATLLI